MKLQELFEAAKNGFENLGGFWINSNGQLYPVDRSKGISHVDVAFDVLNVSTKDLSDLDLEKQSASAVEKLLDMGWIRVSTLEPEIDFMVEMTSPSSQALAKLKKISSDYKDYKTFYLNDNAMDDYLAFAFHINRYHSVKGSTQPS